MDRAKDAAHNVIEESNPIKFWRRIRELPLVKQVLWLIDRAFMG